MRPGTLSGSATSSQEADARPQTLRLWTGDAPGAQGTADADVPTITIYNPPADKRRSDTMSDHVIVQFPPKGA